MFYSLADEGIQGRTGRPDALLRIADMLVTGAITAAKEMGFRVPEDVPVIGLGDAEQTATPCSARTSQRLYSPAGKSLWISRPAILAVETI